MKATRITIYIKSNENKKRKIQKAIKADRKGENKRQTQTMKDTMTKKPTQID